MPNVVTPEGQPLRVDVTLDEMETGVKLADEEAKAAAKAAEDEANRQKAAAANADDPKVTSLREALRLSEESRQRLESSLAGRTAEPPPPAREEKELTKEELTELHQKDPMAAIEYMQTRAIKTVEENLARRLQPLVTGNASTLEEQMRAKYPDEFQLFGREIADLVAKGDKAVFSVAKNWEDMISWIRGSPGNFDKLVNHRAEKKKQKDTADAQAMQIASAGAHVGSQVRTPTPVAASGAFDDTTKEIIKELTNSGILDAKDPEADYRRWLNVGR